MQLVPDLNTLEGKQIVTARGIQTLMSSGFNQLKRTCDGIATFVLANPAGLTPQQVLVLIGTSAGQLVALWQYSALILNTITPGTVSTELPPDANGHAQSIVVAQDGTATIVSAP